MTFHFGVRILITLDSSTFLDDKTTDGTENNPYHIYQKLKITQSTEEPTEDNVIVTAETETNYTIQYQLEEGIWKNYTNEGITVEKNGEVKIRLIDESNENEVIVEKTITIDNIYKIATENTTINGEEGSYDNPTIPKGFKPVDEGEAIWRTEDGWNKGLVIEDESKNQYVWVPVNATLTSAMQTKLDNGEELTVQEIQSVWQRNSSTQSLSYYLEPYTSGYATEQKEYMEMGTSVLKNGGFYIARYEGGTETPRTAGTDKTSTLLSQANVYPYNFISWGKAMNDTGEANEGSKGAVELCKELYTGKEVYGVNSNLIYGVQWDSVMSWIQNERNTTSDSKSWGNYSNSIYTIPAGTEYYNGTEWVTAENEIENSTSDEVYLLKTGVYATTKTNGIENTQGIVKNIYDLAGNVAERTMEAYSNGSQKYRVNRGGAYIHTGGEYPAAHRSSDPSPANVGKDIGVRAALYIKSK